MRVVVDTVVFVRALINPKGRWGRLLFELRDRYDIVLSPEIAEEILTVLYRSELRKKFPQIDEIAIGRVLALFEQAGVVEQTEKLRVCRDPTDDKFFECAKAGAAGYIISEDRDILDVGEYDGIQTVSAARFMELLGG
ncbi:MAG TPA: putative toxin-antitoxin system toxin component, PIN family [Dehalococcoidia bacterium]|jgi:putative PIN family toxin of toxin-antitoxin system